MGGGERGGGAPTSRGGTRGGPHPPRYARPHQPVCARCRGAWPAVGGARVEHARGNALCLRGDRRSAQATSGCAGTARGRRRRRAHHQVAGYSPTRHIDSYPRRVHSPVRSAAARVRDVERHSCRYTRQRAAGDSEPHCGGHQREHPAALLEATGGAHQVATRGRPV